MRHVQLNGLSNDIVETECLESLNLLNIVGKSTSTLFSSKYYPGRNYSLQTNFKCKIRTLWVQFTIIQMHVTKLSQMNISKLRTVKLIRPHTCMVVYMAYQIVDILTANAVF